MNEDETETQLFYDYRRWIAFGECGAGKTRLIAQLLLGAPNAQTDHQAQISLLEPRPWKVPVECPTTREDMIAWYTTKDATLKRLPVKINVEGCTIVITDTRGGASNIPVFVSALCGVDHALIVVTPQNLRNNPKARRESVLRSQLFAARATGVKRFVICINFKDEEINVDEYDEATNVIRNLLNCAGVPGENVNILPVSLSTLSNVFTRDESLDFYDGDTVWNYIQQKNQRTDRSEQGVRFTCEYVQPKRKGTRTEEYIISGTLHSGIIDRHTKLFFQPAFDQDGGVRGSHAISMQHLYQPINSAGVPGAFISFCLFPKFMIQNRNIKDIHRTITSSEDTSLPRTFLATILFIGSDRNREMKVGFCPLVCAHSERFVVRVTRILSSFKVQGQATENPPHIKAGHYGLVEMSLSEIHPHHLVYLETHTSNPTFGTIVVLDNSNVAAVGRIESLGDSFEGTNQSTTGKYIGRLTKRAESGVDTKYENK